jgi:DDE superfamily endonuclease
MAMLSLPIAFRSAIGVFAPVFSRPVWQQVQVLLTGAVLAPGPRTVTAILRIMGLSATPNFQTSHRVLHRAVWSPLHASRLLLRLLGAVFVPRGVGLFGLDDPIERRRGEQMTAKGIYRDPVRSSPAQMVKASGLRWLGGMVLTPIAGAKRGWALPFLTVLCPSERCYAQRGRRHHTVLERAWQSIRLVRRWLPDRALVCVADSSFAALAWLALVARLPRVRVLTRLRLDAALSAPPPPRAPGQRGRPRLTGKRRPTLEAVLADEKTPWSTLTVDDWYGEGPREVEVTTATAVWYHTGKPPVALRWVLMRAPQERCKPQALLSTNLEYPCTQMLAWLVRRWTMAVPCEAARAHLGMATQRQWNDRAIARATPALLSLYSVMTLTAQLLSEKGETWVYSTAW